MAEYTIDTDANVFSIDIEHPHPWICRDDDGDYWTVFKNLSNDIEIHKSEDNGVTWANKKTLTDADYTGAPFPMDGFCITNLKGQDKVYIFMYKKADKKGYSWIINTLTDVGSIDLDDDVFSTTTLLKVEAIWNEYDNKLYLCYGDTAGYGRHREIKLDGTLGTLNSQILLSGGRAYGYAIDSNGDFFIDSMSLATYTNYVHKVGITTKELGIDVIYDFANLLCDYQDKVVLGCVYSNGLHIFKISNDLSTIEINNATYALGFTPSSCFMTIDGINDIYFAYTNTTDDEAYSIKYDISESTWGTPIKISSDNDGLLVCPELKVPINENKLLVTYQATA